jgi:hypothetical protein
MEILDEKLPNFFYKYIRTENAIKILENKALWFSSPRDFNDPFDCNINLIDFSISDKEITEFINDKVSANRKTRRNEIQKNQRNSYRIKNQMADQSQEMFYNSGVCCFSEVNNNILLWAHYANNHKGLCLKFSSSVAIIAEMTAKVNYKTGYEKVNFWTGQGGAVYHLIFTKSNDWDYEKEIRMFRTLYKGSVTIDITNLTEIIFGCKTDLLTIKKVKNLISDLNYKHIKFKQAKQTKSSFQLRID